MGIGTAANLWWRDVLENGPGSPAARFFDVDWTPVKAALHAKVLLPILGDQYGRVLERGELALEFLDGRLVVRYAGHELPINPKHAPQVLRLSVGPLTEALGADNPQLHEFLSILTSLQNLPGSAEQDPSLAAERQREKEVARARLARLVADSPIVGGHIDAAVRETNGEVGRPESFNGLHDLLEAQSYRLSYWRTASHEINYRRFFDVNTLAGLRVEDPAVFEATHALLSQLVAEGKRAGRPRRSPRRPLRPDAVLRACCSELAGGRPLRRRGEDPVGERDAAGALGGVAGRRDTTSSTSSTACS